MIMALSSRASCATRLVLVFTSVCAWTWLPLLVEPFLDPAGCHPIYMRSNAHFYQVNFLEKYNLGCKPSRNRADRWPTRNSTGAQVISFICFPDPHEFVYVNSRPKILRNHPNYSYLVTKMLISAQYLYVGIPSYGNLARASALLLCQDELPLDFFRHSHDHSVPISNIHTTDIYMHKLAAGCRPRSRAALTDHDHIRT